MIFKGSISCNLSLWSWHWLSSFGRMLAFYMPSICAITSRFWSIKFFGAIITNDYLSSIGVFNLLHMNLEKIEFLALLFYHHHRQEFQYEEEYLVYFEIGLWMGGSELRNYNWRILFCILHIGLMLKKFKINHGVKIHIFVLHDTFTFGFGNIFSRKTFTCH